jgi:exonuclease III
MYLKVSSSARSIIGVSESFTILCTSESAQNNKRVVMVMGDFNIIPADVDMHNPEHPYHDTNASASEEERG